MKMLRAKGSMKGGKEAEWRRGASHKRWNCARRVGRESGSGNVALAIGWLALAATGEGRRPAGFCEAVTWWVCRRNFREAFNDRPRMRTAWFSPTPVVNGRRPDSRAVRDGLQVGAARDAREKTVPSRARRSRFGVRLGVLF